MRVTLASLDIAEEDRSFQGIPIVVEHPKGSTRTGTDAQGEEWSRKMQADYGYIEETSSRGDGEEVDVYIGPDEESPTAYVVEQLKEDGSFDEVKIMLAFPDEDSAQACYLQHYPQGWESRIGSIWPLPVKRLRELVKEDQTKDPNRAKQARFLTTKECYGAADRHFATPGFQKVLKDVVDGKQWKELSHSEQIKVLQEDHRREFAEQGIIL